MAGASAILWLAITAVTGPRTGWEVWWGMVGPLAAATVSWIAAERVYQRDPASLTRVTTLGFAAMLLFFAAYTILMLRALSLRPVPFIASFTGYFVALHAVEARFCRWLLSCHDRIDSNTVNLTQEFLADMLGVQRTTVTAVAGSMQAKGLIRYRRGVVDILDRAGLEAMACECYGAVRRGYERLLPASFG